MHSSVFSHPTKFDLLGELSSDEDLIDLFEPSRSPKKVSKTNGVGAPQTAQTAFTMMPPFDDPFWSVYGNKLRVNGTVEGVCPMRSR